MKAWPTKPLREFVAKKSGSVDPSKFPEEVFDLYSIPAFDTGEPEVRSGHEIGSAKQVVETGDVLLSRIVPHIRRTWVVGANQGRRLIASGEWIVFRSRELHPRFLRYFLVGDPFHSRFMRTVSGVGGSLLRAKATEVAKIDIPVPPLAEQERIVKLLDEADELRKLRNQADERTAGLIPALFHELFGNTEYLEKTIGQLLEEGLLLLHKDGNHGSLYPRSSDFGIEGIPFLAATCITDEGTIDHSEVKRLAEEKASLLRHGWIERGDVLLAHNASVGAVGYYDGDYDRAIIGTSLTAFRVNPDRIESRFLWAALRDVYFQHQLEKIMKQALRNQVPITAQRELSLRIPKLPLQKEFAGLVTEIRDMEAKQLTSRRRLDELFKSMLHRAFNGEL